MAEYVTFLAKTPDGNVLEWVTVTAYTAEWVIAFQESFDLRTPGVAPTHVELAAGTYYVTARTDGYIFPLHYVVVIPPGAGPTAPLAFVVELPASPSTRAGTAAPCRVYGWVDVPSPNSLPGSAVPTHGTTYSDGPSMGGVSVSLDIWFRLHARATGEAPSTAGRARTRVAADRHGYFECLLLPNCTYSVSLPNVAGVRYLRTPGPGEQAALETLVDASLSTSFHELS